MKKEIKNNSFVFYATSLEAVEKISEAYPEMGNELLKAIVEYGIYGEYDKTNPIIEAMMVNISFGIDKAKDRYTKAVENGKQGGRPKMIDNEKVRELKEAGLTNREVAERLGCSVSSVEKANKENRETRKNRKNPNDNVNVNVNENVKDNESLHFLSDGYVEEREDWIDNIIENFYEMAPAIQKERLKREFGISDKKVNEVLNEIFTADAPKTQTL